MAYSKVVPENVILIRPRSCLIPVGLYFFLRNSQSPLLKKKKTTFEIAFLFLSGINNLAAFWFSSSLFPWPLGPSPKGSFQVQTVSKSWEVTFYLGILFLRVMWGKRVHVQDRGSKPGGKGRIVALLLMTVDGMLLWWLPAAGNDLRSKRQANRTGAPRERSLP